MKLNEFKKKVIVNVKDGKVVGKVYDVDFSQDNFTIESLCVRNKAYLFDTIVNLFFDKSVVIDVNCIEKIGKDVILVNLVTYNKW